MAYVINADKCKGCGDCADACPVGIIEKDEETGKYVIATPDECLECGSCQGVCGNEAIEEG